MALIEFLFGRSTSQQETEDSLWGLDPDESKDPALHARRCASRWKVMVRLMHSVQRSNTQIRNFLLLIAVLLVMNASPEFAAIVGTVARAFGIGG